MMSPRQIKAKRILLGYRVKDLAAQATKALDRHVGQATVSNILQRRMSGEHDPRVHALQRFLAKKLRIPVRDLKPPFEISGFATK